MKKNQNQRKTQMTKANKVKDKKPICKLFGSDGNVFSIISRVRLALTKANQDSKAEEFTKRAKSSHSYSNVIALCDEYVDVE